MNIRRVAQLILYDDKHRILLQDREGYKSGMKWGFFGGKIEEGETPKQALVRELREELELTLNPKSYTFLGTFTSNIADLKIEHHVFLYSFKHGTKLRQHEGAGRKWFTPKEAFELKNFSDGDKAIITSFVNELGL